MSGFASDAERQRWLSQQESAWQAHRIALEYENSLARLPPSFAPVIRLGAPLDNKGKRALIVATEAYEAHRDWLLAGSRRWRAKANELGSPWPPWEPRCSGGRR